MPLLKNDVQLIFFFLKAKNQQKKKATSQVYFKKKIIHSTKEKKKKKTKILEEGQFSHLTATTLLLSIFSPNWEDSILVGLKRKH